MSVAHEMFGVVLTGHGGADRLEWRDDLAVPQPAAGEVRIHVHAAGVNNTDINTRVGWYSKGAGDAADAGWGGEALSFPRIQGADVCGTIVEVGEGVEASRVGERVIVEPCLWETGGRSLDSAWYLGSECDGGFAEFTAVASRHVHRVDCELSDIELASFPCSASTAENMLTRARVGETDTVLVTGASGGVGSAAVQLAAARGARVVGVTTAAKADAVRALGADQIIDRGAPFEQTLGAGSVDVVIDLVAGPQWPSLLDVLRPGGRYAVSGAIAGPIVELDVRTLYLKDLSFFGCTVLDPEVFASLVRRIEQGAIRPVVAETFALRDIAEAQTAFEAKGHIGKIVLEVSPRSH